MDQTTLKLNHLTMKRVITTRIPRTMFLQESHSFISCEFMCSIRSLGDLTTSFELSLPLFDCLFCKPHVLTEVTIIFLHLHKLWNAHLPGSPLRISYGDPTNPSFLFARYGFLEEDTPATFCKIIPAHINKDMEDLGYAENKMLFYKTGELAEEVCTVNFWLVASCCSRNTLCSSLTRTFYFAT